MLHGDHTCVSEDHVVDGLALPLLFNSPPAIKVVDVVTDIGDIWLDSPQTLMAWAGAWSEQPVGATRASLPYESLTIATATH